MVVNRGDIFWAALPIPRGSEPGFQRPVIIVSANEFNKSRIETVLAVVITSNMALAEAPGNVSLKPAESGLAKHSIANVSQIITLDREFLHERIGKLSAKRLAEVDLGLRLVLAL